MAQVRDIAWYTAIANEMRREDKERDNLHKAMEDMYHLQWDLPTSIKNLQWIRKFLSTDPFDALRAMTRLLSALRPQITLQPLAHNEPTKRLANQIERALTWHLDAANRRGRAKVISDIVLSAGRNDEIAAQVVMLSVQAGAIGMEESRVRAARRNGPFAVLVRNPRFVHSRYSDWMLENVAYIHTVRTQEIIDFWGDKASGLQELLMNDPTMLFSTLYDYWDLSVHAVWAFPGEQGVETEAEGSPVVILPPTEHNLNFIPWVIRVGGTNLDDKPEFQRNPFLYSVYRAGQWVSQNILNTLVSSEGIAYAAAPRVMTTSADPDNPPGVNYGEAGAQLNLRTGETAQQMSPPQIDSGLIAIADRLGQAIDKSTISRVLQTGDFPAGTAYATLNLATQSAVKSISPHKALAEYALADICAMMLMWVDYTKEPLVSYGIGAEDKGEQLIIHPGDFDVDNLYIDVQLTADLPTDHLSHINAAAIAVNQLGMSRERGLEEAGVADPQAEMQQSMNELIMQNELQIALRTATQQAEMQQQMLAVQMQQMMMQQMQQAQQGQQMQQPGGGQGQGFNPQMGGLPPAMAQPGATREMQTGVAQGGVPNFAPEGGQ